MQSVRVLLRTSRWFRALSTVVATLTAFTVFVGLLHTRPGRVFWTQVLGGGCPVGRASAAEVEAGRREAARLVRGTQPAPARPALGFQLDRTQKREVDAWIVRQQLSCRERREGSLLVCSSVPAEAMGRVGGVFDEVTLAFSPSTHALVNIAAMRYRLSPAQAVEQTRALQTQLRAALGAPSRSAGALEAEALTAHAYATSTLSYEFSDFLAEVTATNIPGQGVLLREHYMSAL